MSMFYKNVYKGLPVKIEIRKPRFYYRDIWCKFDVNGEFNIDLVPFEGIDYVTDNCSISYGSKVLWDFNVINNNQMCLAKRGEDYLCVDNEGIVSNLSGCLLEGKDVSAETMYYGFARGKEIILSKTDDDIDGYTCVGEIVVPEHQVATYYNKNYFEPNDSLVYSLDDDGHIWCNLNSNGELTANKEVVVGVEAGTSFGDYEIIITMKVVADSVSGYRKLFMFDGMNWFGTNDGKLCIYDKLTANQTLSAGVVYWIKFSEQYVYHTNTYTKTISYIKDDDYVEGSSDNVWTSKSSSSTSPWLGGDVKLIGIGSDDTNERSWKGSIDLMNTKIEFVFNGDTRLWWKPLD